MVGRAIASIAMIIEDLASGYLLKHLKNGKIVLSSFVAIGFILSEALVVSRGTSANAHYIICPCIGFSMGCWGVFVTTAAEQFGTNISRVVKKGFRREHRESFDETRRRRRKNLRRIH